MYNFEHSSLYKMTNVRVIRRERFNAAHRLFNPNWSDKKNEQIFGKCANKNWHGHNYELFVTVEGPIDPDTGYVMDLKKLSDIIKHNVVDKMDHRNLNLEVDFMKGVITTAENIAVKIYEQIEKDIKSTTCSLLSVKLYETENNYVEYYG